MYNENDKSVRVPFLDAVSQGNRWSLINPGEQIVKPARGGGKKSIISIALSASMKPKQLNAHHKSQGQSMVEFALLLPFLVLLIVGIFDLGRVFFSLITITNAAREGARYGTLHPSDEAGMEAAAVAEAVNSGIALTADNVVVNCSKDTSGRCFRGGALRVTVNYTFESLLNLFMPATINLSRYIEMASQ
jgi:hypothetical protein